jgi:hypothetical protein
MVTISLLRGEDCPNWEHARDELHNALASLGMRTEFEIIIVRYADQAEALDFGGSPTITAAGVDIFGHDTGVPALACRVYATPLGLKGWPQESMIIDALKAAQPS